MLRDVYSALKLWVETKKSGPHQPVQSNKNKTNQRHDKTDPYRMKIRYSFEVLGSPGVAC